jgi:hypothetical protein
MRNPWMDLPAAGDYTHPRDVEVLAACTANFGPEHAIHLECLPEPFLGDPSAPVVLLSRNPGFDPRDPAVHQEPRFVAACRANLRHEPAEYPFYLLAPDLADTPGGMYWRGKLAYLAKRVKRALDLADDEDAWRVVARNVACIEYHGYHSKEYRPLGVELFTQSYGHELVQAAMGRAAVIIALRATEDWLAALPALRTYDQLHRLNSARNVVLTPTNCPRGWVPVVARILASEGVPTFSPGPEDAPKQRSRTASRGRAVNVAADGADYTDPQETVRLLDVLEEEHGFTVRHFRLLHHFGKAASIGTHRSYCADTGRFQAKSPNVVVARRLATCLASREGGGDWGGALVKARREHLFPLRKDGTPWNNAA